jgi:hypothetical protein
VTAYGYAACGVILAGCAAYAVSVLRDRRRDRRTQPQPSPAHDTIQLRDDEEDAFADLMVGWFRREDAT